MTDSESAEKRGPGRPKKTMGLEEQNARNPDGSQYRVGESGAGAGTAVLSPPLGIETLPPIPNENQGIPGAEERKPGSSVNFCRACGSRQTPFPCLITKTHTDQRGTGYKGFICPDCGTIRIARGTDGRFVYGYQDKWHEQE